MKLSIPSHSKTAFSIEPNIGKYTEKKHTLKIYDGRFNNACVYKIRYAAV